MLPRILIIDPAGFGMYYNVCLLDALRRAGYEVDLSTCDSPYERLPSKVQDMLRMDFFQWERRFPRLRTSQRLRRIFRAIEYPLDWLRLFVSAFQEYDFVHFIWLGVPAIDTLFITLLRLRKKRIVLTVHNHRPHEGQWFPGRLLEKHIRRQASHIVVLTPFVRDMIVQQDEAIADKITVIPHGDYEFLLDCFSPVSAELAEWPEEQEHDHRPVQFGYFGSLKPYKGIDDLLKAFAILLRNLEEDHTPKPVLNIIGTPADHRYSESIQTLLKEHSLVDSVHTDFRYIPLGEIPKYLEEVDVGMLPYREATQSGNVHLYYAASCPVIATNAGGLKDQVFDGKTGWLVAPSNPEALAEAMLEAVHKPDEIRRRGVEARTFYENNLRWPVLISEFASVYPPDMGGGQ